MSEKIVLPVQQRVTRTPGSLSRTQDTARVAKSVPRLCEKAASRQVGSVDKGCAKIATLASTACTVSLSSADT